MKKAKEAGRLWIRMMKGHRAVRDLLVPCERDDVQSALRDGLHTLDMSTPVWLPRHQKDWQDFALTRFLPEHFVEPVDFERMEISYIAPEDEKKPPKRYDLDD